MARPRTKNSGLKNWPNGMRQVGGRWYWRGTDAETRAIAAHLKGTVGLSAGKTVKEAVAWWGKHVAPRLGEEPAETGTIRELLQRYAAEELPRFSREATIKEYQGRLGRLTTAFGALPYAKTPEEAMRPGVLRGVDVTRHLHANRHRGPSANKDVQLLSRVFRLANVAWGLTTYNPCSGVEYLAERPRDVYITDDQFRRLYEAAGLVLKAMMSIAQQTGAREGSIFAITKADISPGGLTLKVGKKKNRAGFTTKQYVMTPDLRAAIDMAIESRPFRLALPDDALFVTRANKPYTKDSFKSLWATVRRKCGLGSREITFHDIRGKAASDSESDIAAQQLLDHEDPAITRRVYRRKREASVPLRAVAKTTKG